MRTAVRSIRPLIAFFVVTWLLGGLWALATPVMGVPDEPAHVIKAASLVRGQLDRVVRGRDPDLPARRRAGPGDARVSDAALLRIRALAKLPGADRGARRRACGDPESLGSLQPRVLRDGRPPDAGASRSGDGVRDAIPHGGAGRPAAHARGRRPSRAPCSPLGACVARGRGHAHDLLPGGLRQPERRRDRSRARSVGDAPRVVRLARPPAGQFTCGTSRDLCGGPRHEPRALAALPRDHRCRLAPGGAEPGCSAPHPDDAHGHPRGRRAHRRLAGVDSGGRNPSDGGEREEYPEFANASSVRLLVDPAPRPLRAGDDRSLRMARHAGAGARVRCVVLGARLPGPRRVRDRAAPASPASRSA